MTTATITYRELSDRRADLGRRSQSLRDRRPGLALAATSGDRTAGTELATVDAELAEIARDLELLDVAQEEAARLATVARQEADAEDRRRLEAEYARAEADRTAAYRALEATIADFVEQARAAAAASVEMDRLWATLGRQPGRAIQLETRRAIVGRLCDAVWSRVGWPGMLPAMPTGPLIDDKEGAA